MPHLWNDLSYSVRSLLRSPALAVTIVLTVGLGIGATTGMATVVRAVFVNPLPYAASEQIYWIYTDTPPFHFRFSVVDYRALEADHPAFSEVAAYQTSQMTLVDGGQAELVPVKSVTGSYFPLMRQTPHLGRLFNPSDDGRHERLAVLTHGYWMTRFGGDPSVMSRTILLDGTPYVVAGVLQPTAGPLEASASIFTVADWPVPKRKGPFFTMVLGRLRPEMSHDTATATLRATNTRLFPIWRSSYQDEKATWGMQPLKERVVGTTADTLLFALAAVACVLLIACANAVNLLVARAAERGRELAVRTALGASRQRLLQHLLSETAILTIAAAGVGLGVAAGTIHLVRVYGPGTIPRINEIALSTWAFGCLAVLAVASGLVVGVVPAVQGVRTRLERALRGGGRSATAGPGARHLRRLLVACEFALATPLIVAAVLVTVSLTRLSHVGVGIDTSRLLTASVSLSGARYTDDDTRAQFWRSAVERLAALPGVEGAALADGTPPAGVGNLNNFDLEDHPAPGGQNQPVSPWVSVSSEYFKTVGLTLERGRLLEPADATGPPVVVVDRAWADQYFRGQEVIGRRFHEGGCTTCPWVTVVGVVGVVKYVGLDAPDQGTIYSLFTGDSAGTVVLRASRNPEAIAPALRVAIRDLDANLAVTNIATGDDLVSTALATPRYLSVLVGMFAATALALSVVGIYGVMAYFVQQQRRDIGIRLALGGDPSGMRRMIVRQGLQLVGAGVIVGVGAALLSGRLMTTLLFEISATDVRTLIGVPAALIAVAAIACLVPASRAARVDPAEVLRES